MVVGMGVVFSFLVMLVILMRVSGALLNKLPEPETAPARVGGNGQTSQTEQPQTAKVAVAVAAAYRKRHGA